MSKNNNDYKFYLNLLPKIGLCVIVSLLGGIFSGLYLDEKLGANGFITILGFFAGLFLAGLSIYIIISKSIHPEV